MSSTDNFIFTGLKIVTWIIFVGLCIEAGGLVVNFIFSIYKPGFVPNLYQKLNLIELYKRDSFAFFGTYSFILSISILKALLFYELAILVTTLDLANPFNNFVAKKISLISYYAFSIGLLSYIARGWSKKLPGVDLITSNVEQFWADSQAFILMSAVIYVIAKIFNRGISLQSENDLTV